MTATAHLTGSRRNALDTHRELVVDGRRKATGGRARIRELGRGSIGGRMLGEHRPAGGLRKSFALLDEGLIGAQR